MGDVIVKLKIKELIQEKGFKVSAELYPVLSNKVNKLLQDAMDRAEANGRKTILGRDI